LVRGRPCSVVWLTARRLHEALAGQVLTRSDFRVPRYARRRRIRTARWPGPFPRI